MFFTLDGIDTMTVPDGVGTSDSAGTQSSSRHITRVATTVGPLDAQHLAVGGTMRCLIDCTNSFNILRDPARVPLCPGPTPNFRPAAC
jgi:hypothetical protein